MRLKLTLVCIATGLGFFTGLSALAQTIPKEMATQEAAAMVMLLESAERKCDGYTPSGTKLADYMTEHGLTQDLIDLEIQVAIKRSGQSREQLGAIFLDRLGCEKLKGQF